MNRPDSFVTVISRWPAGGMLLRRLRSLACGVILVAAGCGTSKGVIFEPVTPPRFWPQPPDAARIHFVGALASEADLKPARSFGRAVKESLFGKDEVRCMLSPFALCTDGGDRLFVCDSNAQLVHVFNLQTREYQQWRPTADSHQPGFSQPVGVAWDPRGRLLVSDSVAGGIFVFDAQGGFLGEIGTDSLKRPCGLVIDSVRNRIFVADAAAHQVLVLAFDGELISRIGERGSELGQFNYPTNVALDSKGQLYVSDTLNFRVQVFDADCRPVMQIGRHGDLPGYFSQPKGLALDSEDHLYVVDANFEAVQLFDARGAVLMSFGEEGHAPGQFWLPAGIFIDDHDRIWIADSYNRRVQVFEYRPEAQP